MSVACSLGRAAAMPYAVSVFPATRRPMRHRPRLGQTSVDHANRAWRRRRTAGERVEGGFHGIAVGDDLAVLFDGVAGRPAGRNAGYLRPTAAADAGGRGGRRRRVVALTVDDAQPVGVQTSMTAISLRVRVPVLSVHMNVVDTRVSTASRRRTSARRPAMHCAPIASDSVTVGSSPQGTTATVSRRRTGTRPTSAFRPGPPCRRTRHQPTMATAAMT